VPVKSPINRVVVLMLENRSFDHMLGRFTASQVNGILDANGQVDPSYSNPSGNGVVSAGQPAAYSLVIPGNKGFEGP